MHPRAATLESLMTRDVTRVSAEDPLALIRNLLRQRGFHHVLVVEDGRVLGVISDRDVLRTLSPFLDTVVEQPRDVHTLGIKARQIMSSKLISASLSTTVAEAVELMLDHGISCLPITDADGLLLGIVTSKDILKFAGSDR